MNKECRFRYIGHKYNPLFIDERYTTRKERLSYEFLYGKFENSKIPTFDNVEDLDEWVNIIATRTKHNTQHVRLALMLGSEADTDWVFDLPTFAVSYLRRIPWNLKFNDKCRLDEYRQGVENGDIKISLEKWLIKCGVLSPPEPRKPSKTNYSKNAPAIK